MSYPPNNNPYGAPNQGNPNQPPLDQNNQGWSQNQKIALGVGLGVAAAGVAAIGATAIGVGGYKFYQSHQGSEQDKSPLKLYAHVHSARNLQAADRGSKELTLFFLCFVKFLIFYLLDTSDPYVVLSQGHIQVKTKTINKNLNPMWDERLDFGVHERDRNTGDLHIKVFDKDTFSDDSLGDVHLPLSQIPEGHAKEFNLNVCILSTLRL